VAGQSAVSLEEFYSERWNAALLTALGGVPCHHLANPLRLSCYKRAIAGVDAFASELFLKHHMRVVWALSQLGIEPQPSSLRAADSNLFVIEATLKARIAEALTQRISISYSQFCPQREQDFERYN
jgi:hypothetical protein